MNQSNGGSPGVGTTAGALAELRPGQRISLRYRLPSGEPTELVGLILSHDTDAVVVRDRGGKPHQISRDAVLAARIVGVPRGRDPRRTPPAELDRIATAAGLTGRAFVARLSDLLADQAPPPPLPWQAAPPAPANLSGEWVSCGSSSHLIEVAWWASHHDARNIQVRTTDPTTIADLHRLGFTAP